jgi:hypothetical protein
MKATKTANRKIEEAMELAIILFFEESSAKSRLPSSTIRINPITPIIGSKLDKSGTLILKLAVNELINMPVIIKRITPGILVNFADNSKI